MGNRFASLPQYHQIVKAHGVIAAITFLFIVPIAILIARYSRSPNATRHHVYLQIMTVGLSTVVLTLGWFAVGPERSLTNPHHGIGVAIYTLIMVQAIGGWWNYKRKKSHRHRKPTIKMVLHWWIGRAIALLGIAQVALGLTLYGSPKFLFVLYTLWLSFLLLLFFVLSYRSIGDTGGIIVRDGSISHGGTVIEDKKPSMFGGLLGPLAAGAGAAALLGGRNRSRSRSRREEVIPSRRGSGSYIEEEKYEESRRKKSGGAFDTLLKGAAVLGAAGLAKSWWDRRKKKDEDYDSVDHDTPSRRHRRHDSVSEESVEVHRMEEGRRDRPILPGPGNPALAAAALSAAEPRSKRPRTPRRQQSFDSADYSYDSTMSPSRRPRSSHRLEKGVLAGLGLGWFAKKMKDRRDKKELDRLDREEAERIERERLAREGGTPSRLTGDGYPSSPRRKLRRPPPSGMSSEVSSVIDNPHGIRPGGIPPIPAAMAAGAVAGVAAGAMQSRSSRQNVVDPVVMPPAPPDPHGILHEESGSEAYNSAGGQVHRRRSSRRRKEGEAAAAAAAAGAAALAAEEEARRRRSRSRGGDGGEDVNSPPVSVKVKVHDDANRHVTLRRLTEQEAAAEREARKSDRRRRRADSLSSLSGTDTGSNRRRYRRDEREAERRAESSVGPPPPPPMAPLSPPNPAFAGGRRPKDSAYYSGRPDGPSGSGPVTQGSGVGSPESHGTWSGMSPSGSEAMDERRRRRRAERNRQNTPGTVDFS
jgi:hypothetical protein